jgi:hypothetical protein
MIRVERRSNGLKPKNIGGTFSKGINRWVLCIGGRKILRSVAVWIYHNGTIPDGFLVDHVNGDKQDDRIENLRLATPTENMRNRRKPSSNTSGYVGVSFHKKSNKWRASIRGNAGQISLGHFDDRESAAAVYEAKKKEFFGSFACDR